MFDPIWWICGALTAIGVVGGLWVTTPPSQRADDQRADFIFLLVLASAVCVLAGWFSLIIACWVLLCIWLRKLRQRTN